MPPEMRKGIHSAPADIYCYGRIVGNLRSDSSTTLDQEVAMYLDNLADKCTKNNPDTRIKVDEVIQSLEKNKHLFPPVG